MRRIGIIVQVLIVAWLPRVRTKVARGYSDPLNSISYLEQMVVRLGARTELGLVKEAYQ